MGICIRQSFTYTSNSAQRQSLSCTRTDHPSNIVASTWTNRDEAQREAAREKAVEEAANKKAEQEAARKKVEADIAAAKEEAESQPIIAEYLPKVHERMAAARSKYPQLRPSLSTTAPQPSHLS